jgi:hypothetical protein
MKLLTVGDSFTYGDELEDLLDAWPYVLGNAIKYQVTNLGSPGTGNDLILQSAIDNYEEYDIVIIAWSHFARIDFHDYESEYTIWPGGNLTKWNDVTLEHRAELQKYIDKHHNDVYYYHQYIWKVVSLQQFFKSINQKYIMINSFGNNVMHEHAPTEKLKKLIDPTYYVGWPGKTMMEMVGTNIPRGPGGHFLELGHQIVATRIYERIRDLGWIS